MTKLQNYIKFKNGKKRPKEIGPYSVFGGNGILGYTNDYNAEKCIIIGRVGAYCGCVYRSNDKCWISDNAICGITYEFSDLNYFYYLFMALIIIFVLIQKENLMFQLVRLIFPNQYIKMQKNL